MQKLILILVLSLLICICIFSIIKIGRHQDLTLPYCINPDAEISSTYNELHWLKGNVTDSSKHHVSNILEFNRLKGKTAVSIATLKLDSNNLYPSDFWKKELKENESYIVSSGNEFVICDPKWASTTNNFICAGCLLKYGTSEESERPLEGKVAIDICKPNSRFSSIYGLDRVLYAVAITHLPNDSFSKKRDSLTSLLSAKDSKNTFPYVESLINTEKIKLFNRYKINIKNCIENILIKLSAMDKNVVLLVPAIGTNYGISKKDFYDIFFQVLTEKENEPEFKLPYKIFLTVNPEENPVKLNDTYNAIVNNIFLIRQKIQPNKNDVTIFYNLIGIFLSLIFFIATLKRQLIYFEDNTIKKINSNLVFVIIGLGLLSFGFLQTLEKLKITNYLISIGLPYSYSNYMQLAIAFISLPVTLSITKAKKLIASIGIK